MKIAVIRVRGDVNLRHDVKSTFKHLNLLHKNWCVVLDDSPSLKGMLAKIKDYATWGEIDETTFKEMVEKRGELYLGRDTDNKGKIKYDKFIVIDGKKYKKYFRLNAPKKGYGRKGVKVSFSKGGALGYRGDKINDLIKRML